DLFKKSSFLQNVQRVHQSLLPPVKIKTPVPEGTRGCSRYHPNCHSCQGMATLSLTADAGKPYSCPRQLQVFALPGVTSETARTGLHHPPALSRQNHSLLHPILEFTIDFCLILSRGRPFVNCGNFHHCQISGSFF